MPGRVDLGDAAHPRNNRSRPVEHPWFTPRLRPSRYILGYKLDQSHARGIRQAFHNFARKVGHRRITKDRFYWRPPPGCKGSLRCVYEVLVRQGRDGIRPIAALFRQHMVDNRANALTMAQLVIAFAQEIPYRLPAGEPFGLLPPALVVSQRFGDCDSKAVLAHMLLGSLGIRSVLITSEAHRHTMLGVALPSGGASFRWRGTRYAFVEITAKRAPLGYIKPSLTRPNDWRAQPLDVNVMRGSASGSSGRKRPSLRERWNRFRGTMDGGPIRIAS